MKTPAENRGDGGGREDGEQIELFQREFSASYPNPNTKDADALRDLLVGKHLRQRDWLSKSWRLAACVDRLKDLGWPIVSTPVYGAQPRRGKPEAEYCLAAWALRELGTLDG